MRPWVRSGTLPTYSTAGGLNIGPWSKGEPLPGRAAVGLPAGGQVSPLGWASGAGVAPSRALQTLPIEVRGKLPQNVNRWGTL